MMCYVIDMFKWRGVVASALFTVVAVTGAVAHAADYMWMSSPADALWNTTSLNWNSGEAWVDGNNAIFGSSSQTAVNIDGSRTATAITVSSGDYTFSGTDTLTLNGEFIVGSGLAATVTAPFASTGDDSSRRFIKTGDGSLTFKNTTASVLRYRHHSGTVTLDNSTLTVTKTGLAGTSDSASAFVMNGGDIILTNNATFKIASGGKAASLSWWIFTWKAIARVPCTSMAERYTRLVSLTPVYGVIAWHTWRLAAFILSRRMPMRQYGHNC